MAIDLSLLTKAAKVYEAGESVEGVKPKEVYESHKKCAPGEFGMNKEGTAGLTGALLGALGGAATSDRGRVNEGAGRGAAIGAGTELGALAGLVPGGVLGGALGYGLGGISGAGLGAVAGGGLGSLGGAALGNSAARGLVGPYKKDNKEDKKEDKKEPKEETKESAYTFGARVKQALDPAVGYGAAGGGLLGAGLGGLAGLINPGEEEDETGRVRRRSRFGAALRGALGGGAAGALGGGALGYLQPNSVNNLTQRLQQMFAGPKPGARLPDPLVNRGGEMQTPDEYRGMLNDNLFYNPKNPTLNVPNAQSGNYLPEYGTPGGRIGPPVR